MDPIAALLAQLGLGVATNAVYDVIKNLATTPKSAPELTRDIQDKINLFGVQMRAETVINALAQNGLLLIQQSHLHGSQGLAFGSYQGSAVVGNNSMLTTDKTAITAGTGAFMQTEGNAQVRQNPDGSISFHIGGDGKVNFKM